MKQGHEISQKQTTISYSSDRKIGKCASSNQILSYKNIKYEKLNDFRQITPFVKCKKQKQWNNSQFLFCLKLKMVGIASALGYMQLQSSVFEEKDANQILSELNNQIKSYISKTTKKQTQLQSLIKKHQIQQINTQSKIKQLQSQQTLYKKQQQRLQKTNNLTISKMSTQIKQLEEDKYVIEEKLIFFNQLVKEERRKCQGLRGVVGELEGKLREVEGRVFEREMEMGRVVGEGKVERGRLEGMCQGYKTSIMKKVQQIQQLQRKQEQLQQVLSRTQQKLQQTQSTNHKISQTLQQTQKQLQNLTKQNESLYIQQQAQKHKYETYLNKQQNKLQQLNKQIQKILNITKSHQQVFKHVVDDVNNMENQFRKLWRKVEDVGKIIDEKLKNVQDGYMRMEELGKQERDIERTQLILDIQRFYKDQINRLQDQNFMLVHQIKLKLQ